MSDIQFGAKLMLDGSVWVNGIEVASAATSKFSATVKQAGADASAAMDKAAASTRDAAAAAERLNQSARSTADTIASQNRQMAASNVERAKSAASVQAQLEAQQKLETQLIDFLSLTDKAYRAQLTMSQGQSLLTQALRSGIITQAEYDARLASLVARYKPLADGAEQAGKGLLGLGISAGFAGREIHALVDEMASGRVNQARGTFLNVLGTIAQTNPAAVAGVVGVLALGGAMVTAVASAESLNRALSQTQAQLIATGRGGEISDAALRQQIATLERLSGISRQAAEEIVSAFAKSAKIGPDLFTQLTGLVADFAVATGEKAPAAAKKLAEAFNDPTKGAKALDAQLNFLTTDQLLQIETMKRYGDTAGQQAVLVDALKGRIQGLHEEGLTPIQKASEALSSSWKNMTTAIGDSGPVKLATVLYGGLLNLLGRYLDVMPQLISRFGELAAKVVPGGPLLAALIAAASGKSPVDNTGKPNFASGTIGRAPGGTTDAAELEETKKRALELAGAYKTQSEAQLEAKQTADFLRETLVKMNAAGEGNTETYRRLSDALVALNQKGTASLESRIASIQQSGKLEVAQYQSQQSLLQDATQREERILAASFQNRLITERSYIDLQAALETKEAQSRLATLNSDIAAREAERARIAALKPKNSTESETQSKALTQVDAELLNLTTQRTKAERDLEEVQVRRGEKVTGLDLKEADYLRNLTQQTSEFIRAEQKQADAQRFELTLIGQTAEVQAKLRAERVATLQVEEQIHKLELDRQNLVALGNADPLSIEAIDGQIDRLKTAMPGIVENAGRFAAQISVASQNASILQGAFQQVSDTIMNGIDQLKENWHSASIYVRDQILTNIWQTLYKLTIQKWILNFGALVTTSILGATGANAATSAGGSIASSVVTNAATSYLGSTALGTAATGAYAGAASAASEAAIGASFVGPSAALAPGAVGAGAEAYSAIAGALGSIPVYGWIALAVIAIAAWLGGRGGGPKVGGSFNAAIDAAGNVTDVAVPGTDNGRFFTPNQGDSEVGKLVKTTAAGYYSTYAALGGTDPSKFTFGLGFDEDPQGTARSRVSSSVYDAQGKAIYDVRDHEMDDKEVPAALQLESERQVLAALQDSKGLNPTVLKILQSLDVKTAGDQAIKDAISLAAAFSSVLKQGTSDFVKDAATAYDIQQGGARAAVKAQGQALEDLASHFDGSMESTQQLAQAQNEYRNSLIGLLVQVRQVKDAVKDMFQSTREHIEQAGLSDQEQYDFLKGKGNQYAAMALAADDPATAQRFAEKANDFFMQAFDMLTPEQQKDTKDVFLHSLDDFQSKFDAHMDQLATDIATDGAAPFKDVAAKMDVAADKILAAADKFNDAADTLANGGPKPNGGDTNVDIHLPDNGPDAGGG